jgi:hypothetical protein
LKTAQRAVATSLPEDGQARVCATNIDADISGVNLPQPPRENPRPSSAPKSALVLMVVIVATMALLALYANVQRWRRDKIETVIVTPEASPSPTTP